MTTSTEMENQSSGNGVQPFRHEIPAHVLANVESFAEAFQLATEVADTVGHEIVFSDELGDGFTGLDKAGKRQLVGKQFIMLTANFGHDETTNTDYVVCRVVTSDNEKYRFADGSTGIYQQILTLVEKTGGFVPIMARKGLRASDYTTKDKNGDTIRATTFYIDESVDD